MVKILTVEGYSAVKKAIQESSGKIYVLFTGSLNENGISWCPDCVKADPIVEAQVNKLTDDGSTVITCHVGPRDYWKDQNNDFRIDPQFKLKCVPTLMKLGTPQRLEEGQCASDDLVSMLFGEDDD